MNPTLTLLALPLTPLVALNASGVSIPSEPDNYDAYDYNERIRESLQRHVQELRERCGLRFSAPRDDTARASCGNGAKANSYHSDACFHLFAAARNAASCSGQS